MTNPDKERYDRLVAEHRDPAKLTAEILAYWQQEVAKARALNEIYVAELIEKSNRLETSERCLRQAERRIDLIDTFERTAFKTGYRTPYILAAVVESEIEEEIERAKQYAGPMVNDYPAVIGVIGYDPKRQQWTLEPHKDAAIYNGDTVIGQVINAAGNQITPDKYRHGGKSKKRK